MWMVFLLDNNLCLCRSREVFNKKWQVTILPLSNLYQKIISPSFNESSFEQWGGWKLCPPCCHLKSHWRPVETTSEVPLSPDTLLYFSVTCNLSNLICPKERYIVLNFLKSDASFNNRSNQMLLFVWIILYHCLMSWFQCGKMPSELQN